MSELAAEHGIAGIDGRRCLNEAGQKAVEVTAERLAALVDQVLGKDERPDAGAAAEKPADASDSGAVGCSCGSGIPVKVPDHRRPVGRGRRAAADLREAPRGASRAPSDAVAQDLLEMVKVYNYVAPEAEAAWREVLAREYAAHCEREVSR